MKLTFKNIIIALGGLLALGLVISFLVLCFKYINQTKIYNEFKTKVEKLNKENEDFQIQVTSFTAQVEEYEREKADLLLKLSKKEIIIKEVEKIIYVNGELQIPEDYESLKNNYVILGDNYELVKSMYMALLEQSKKDSDTIAKGNLLIKTLQDKNAELLDALNNTPVKPEKLFQQSFLLGAGLSIKEEKLFHVGYLITVKNKLQFEIILSYPFSANLLVGVTF